ncbi:MAG: alpha/beta fold hydrolase [Actinomycetota bacterium]|nr:alpha/beta fold hydrolase [Actinomycetota bacterium]
MRDTDERSTFTTPNGPISYVDRGAGPPVVAIHGNPSSASEFLPAFDALTDSYRCIAPDLLGFGCSAKPVDWDHLPRSHAANVAGLLDSLDLWDVTMVVGDWGGPIGLSWVLDHPERVRRVVITNSWMWPLDRSWYYRAYSALAGGPIGRHLTEKHNLFARRVVPAVWGTATPLTPERHAEFTDVHHRAAERRGMWVLPREVVGSSAWLRTLWDRREVLATLDVVLLWGMRDRAFREDILDGWVDALPAARVERLAGVGHFPALEATDRLVEAVSTAAPRGSR